MLIVDDSRGCSMRSLADSANTTKFELRPMARGQGDSGRWFRPRHPVRHGDAENGRTRVLRVAWQLQQAAAGPGHLMTGGTLSADRADFIRDGERSLLSKPVSFETIEKSIEALQS